MSEKSKQVTIADIEHGLGLLAWLIQNHGPAAIPLFDRPERELEQMQARDRRIEHWANKFSPPLKPNSCHLSQSEVPMDSTTFDQEKRNYERAVQKALKVG